MQNQPETLTSNTITTPAPCVLFPFYPLRISFGIRVDIQSRALPRRRKRTKIGRRNRKLFTTFHNNDNKKAKTELQRICLFFKKEVVLFCLHFCVESLTVSDASNEIKIEINPPQNYPNCNFRKCQSLDGVCVEVQYDQFSDGIFFFLLLESGEWIE